MSMLAERKRKTKWVINPTKKPLWKLDLDGIKLGKEIMEKMGWAPGKGLGVHEQGMQEPLKVSYKNDSKGMGFKGNDEDWIEHQIEFNSLLNQLTNSNDDVIVKSSTEEKNKIKSLEEESEKSRNRIHYKKFTRGKDLAQYSENDLACILGTSRTKKDKNVEENSLKKENEKQTEEGYKTSFGVTTINSGSIQDYFKKKWGANKHKSDNCDVLGDMNDNTFISEEPLDVDAKENEGEGEKKKRKGKKRKQESPEHLIKENNSEDIESETVIGVDFESEKPKHKKKKHLVKIQIQEESEEIAEPSEVTNCLDESSVEIINQTQIVCSESLGRRNKKKKKKSRDEVEINEEETEGGLIMDIDEPSTGTNSQVDCGEKNVADTGMLNMEIEESEKIVSENHHENSKRKKSKKKSKEILEENIEELENEVHVKSKKKKKDKKIKKQSDDISTVEEKFKDNGKSEDVSLELGLTNKTKIVEPSCLEETDIKNDEKENESELESKHLFIPETTEEPKVKKKKSKKKKDAEKLENEEVKEESKAEPSEDVKPVPGADDNPKDLTPGDKHLIHSHKTVLFKKNHRIIPPSYYSNERVLNLVCGADILKFKGSNLPDVAGYGVRKYTGKQKESR